MKSIKAILVDDEIHCIETLKYELALNCAEVQVVGTAHTGKEGIELIRKFNPDLVFLDIEMPGMNGFEMLRQLGKADFDIVFVTAYDEYAIQAFRCAATDYLLKPVESRQLVEAIARITKRDRPAGSQEALMDTLLYNLREGLRKPRIALPTGRGIEMVEADEILYCKAEGNYTSIVMTQNRKYTLSRTLKDVAMMLDKMDFFRVHAAYLINFRYLTRYLREDGGYAEMSDGTKIAIAKRRREEFLSKMKTQL